MSGFSSDIQNRIFESVASKLKAQGINISTENVEKVCKSKWEFLSYIIRFGELESFRDKYLGNFGVKRFREAYTAKRHLTSEQKTTYYGLDKKDRAPYLQQLFEEFRERTKYDYRHSEQPVEQLDKKGKRIKLYNSINEASKETGILPITIYLSCSKGIKTKNYYTFKFIEIEYKEETNQDNTE